ARGRGEGVSHHRRDTQRWPFAPRPDYLEDGHRPGRVGRLSAESRRGGPGLSHRAIAVLGDPMGNFSFWEIFLIFIVVLLLFGAKRIPEIAGSMGKGIREFKKSINEVERSIQEPDRPAARLPKEEA